GNQYDSRDYGPSAANDNAYHYSNTKDFVLEINGSYYNSNSNGSTYHNDGAGGSIYT
ncbi:hypothetical protein EJ08DRAFT_563078, partial [Tothia fuscella]